MELSRADLDLLKKFFGEGDLERVVVTGHVHKGVLKIQFDVMRDSEVLKSLRAFIGNGKMLVFESE